MLPNKLIKYLPLGLLLPAIAQAQGAVAPNINIPLIGNGTVIGLTTFLINIALAVSGVIAIAFLIYGGFRYITSAGNEETASEAKRVILNSIIGLVVIILSYTIVVVIGNALGGRVS